MIRVYPHVFGGKLLAAALAAGLAAGCGGGSAEPPEGALQRVGGPGYSFAVPSTWNVERSPTGIAARGGNALVSVTVFPLRVAFEPSLWDKVVPELDRVAAEFAAQEEGTVAASRTVRILGRRARQYDVNAPEKTEQVTFLLVRKREYQLLCTNAGATCAAFLASFRLRT